MPTRVEYEIRKQKALVEAENPPLEKICTKCKLLKLLSDYNNHCVGKYGKHPQCKSCLQKYNSAFYRKNDSYRIRQIKLATNSNRRRK